jgi:cyanate permease
VLAASLVYFGIVACLYGVGFWMPSIVKGFGVSIAATGWINAIPYALGVFMMIWWVRRSDAHMERVGHLAVALAAMAIGIGAAAAIDDPLLKMIALTIGGLGVFAALPVFWTVPTAILSGATAAAGIAAINSLGNLAGYVGPFIVGWIKDATGSFAWGLAAIAALAAIALVTALILGHDPALEKAPEQA